MASFRFTYTPTQHITEISPSHVGWDVEDGSFGNYKCRY